MKAQISFDLVMDDEMPFVEGTYRLPGHDWEVFIFTRLPPNPTQPEIQVGVRWESGVTGVVATYPESQTFNKVKVLRVLSEALGVTEWE